MYKNILVPIDTSNKALVNHVIPHIESLSKFDDPHIHFLVVIPSYKMFIGLSYGIEKEIITEDNQRLKLAEADLKNEVSRFNLPEDRVHYHAILDTPIDGILTTAEKIHADLIIISSRSPNISTKYLLGSTASAVVRYAETSVLVVR
ncbi:TPA: universal stress protein [Morganella morganii]|uniref:Universal stress protein F n=2 Tax=Morganella morganii TaxID=582 RepID=A0A2C5TL60_MORMO|nr:universal stress protein [Morganella morganii]AMG69721.1 universal stress protein F [Morganella morganii]AUR31254.1 universal stress protein F [Morganella morganii]AUU01054.1 universal stress protein F [Morganella morganii]AVD60374.1 universal stress protein F [Morganella morganii]EHZ6679494.1 universal stress protein [Morganella morganii]